MNQILMIAIGILAVMLLICLIRAVIGPSIADRIVSVNMMGTIVMVIIAMLAIMLKEGYLVDICIIYAMISFLSVVALTKIFLGIYRKKKDIEAVTGGKEAGDNYNEDDGEDGRWE